MEKKTGSFGNNILGLVGLVVENELRSDRIRTIFAAFSTFRVADRFGYWWLKKSRLLNDAILNW